MRRQIYICIIALLCLFVPRYIKAGTLIITYEFEEENPKLLERVRFLLTCDNHHQAMYPQGKAYVDDPNGRMRMVLIEDLAAGNYVLDLLIPNVKGIYEEIPSKHFVLENDTVHKLDQLIKRKKE